MDLPIKAINNHKPDAVCAQLEILYFTLIIIIAVANESIDGFLFRHLAQTFSNGDQIYSTTIEKT